MDAQRTETEGAEHRRALTLATERELRAPLRALRVLLEGRSGSKHALRERAFVDRAFVDRALLELLRAERAAFDLIRWTAPRSLCVVPCTVNEVAHSLVSGLEESERERCHFVVECGDAELRTDGRLLVEALARTIEDALARSADATSEVMVHLHASDGEVTLSLVAGSAEAVAEFDPEATRPDQEMSLAEAILERDVGRLGGRVSMHRSAGHRCCVTIVPQRAGERVESIEHPSPQNYPLGGAA